MGVAVTLFLPWTQATSASLQHLETPIREALLKPRNFNPHPYQKLTAEALHGESLRTLSDDYESNFIYSVHPSVGLRPSGDAVYDKGPVQFPAPPRKSALNSRSVRRFPHPYSALKSRGQRAHAVHQNSVDLGYQVSGPPLHPQPDLKRTFR